MKKKLSYRDSGVNIDAGTALVERIKPAIERTHRNGVIGGIGGFGALFELPIDRYRQPILVSGTDGVGTKLMVATMLNKHDTIGIDLVAMCVNDIIVAGAEPLYFLDYYACGRLNVAHAESVIKGIAEGCHQAGCALIGGETAEMPGMYLDNDYDLAGFAVGVVEKDQILSPDKVQVGNVLLGLGSNGPHSNGFSLIRKVIEVSGDDLDANLAGTQLTLAEALLAPTRIYVKSILKLLESVQISAISHITGGGISENLPRVLPDNISAEINLSNWEVPPVFNWLMKHGNIELDEMLKTFNCGIGMILSVREQDQSLAIETLELCGEQVFEIGKLVAADGKPSVQYHYQ